jgi:hypothetical protein
MLIFFRKADLLIPLRLLIIMGLLYWASYGVSGILDQIKEGKGKDYTTLVIKIVLIVFGVLGFIEIPTFFSFSALVEVNMEFSNGFYLVFIFGVIATAVGVLKSIKNFDEKFRSEEPKKKQKKS